MKAFQDFVFKIDDRFKRRSILETSMDNVVVFEMIYGENETIFGYTTVQMDDVQSLVCLMNFIYFCNYYNFNFTI